VELSQPTGRRTILNAMGVLSHSSVVSASLSPTNKVAYSIFATLQNC